MTQTVSVTTTNQHLLKAAVERLTSELGYTKTGDNTLESVSGYKSVAINVNKVDKTFKLTSRPDKGTSIGSLPNMWNEFFEAVAKVEEKKIDYTGLFKEGDMVTAFDKRTGIGAVVGTTFQVAMVETSVVNNSGWWAKGADGTVADFADLRAATVEEIKEYSRKTFVEGAYFIVMNNRAGSINEIGSVYKIDKRAGYQDISFAPAGEGGRWESYRSARIATKDEIRERYKQVDVNVAGYQVEVNSGAQTINFGCQKFTEVEVRAIARLFTLPKTTELKIGGTLVTQRMMQKLLEAFYK